MLHRLEAALSTIFLSETQLLPVNCWYKGQLVQLDQISSWIGDLLNRVTINPRWWWWALNLIYRNNKFSNSNIKLLRLRCMKKWYSSPSHRSKPPQLMKKKHWCSQPLVGLSILLVRLVGTLSRIILSRTRQYQVKIRWDRWPARRAWYSHALPTWEMKIQETWGLAPFTRQTKGAAAVRVPKAPWVNITFNSSSNYSQTKIANSNRLLYSQEKQQLSWCPHLASQSSWEALGLTTL